MNKLSSLREHWSTWQQVLIDSALDSIVIIDEEGLIVDFNQSTEEVFGYKKRDVLGQPMVDLIVHPDLRQAHRDGFERIRKTGEGRILGKRLELPAVRVDGSEFAAELVVVRVGLAPGPLFVGYIRDISERKKAEHALRESEARFRNLADNAPVMIWLSDDRRDRNWFNQVWLDFVGFELSDQIDNQWYEAVHPDDLEHVTSTQREAVEKGSSFSLEYRIRHRDGDYRWVLDNGKPVSTSGEYAGSCVDITERRLAEEKLRVTQFSVDNSQTVILWIGSDGGFVYVNNAACEALGYTRSELLSMRIFDITSSFTPESWPAAAERIRNQNDRYFELYCKRNDGTTFPVEVVANFLAIHGQEFYLTYMQDITRRKKDEEKLRQRRDELAHVMRLITMGEMASSLAHELNQPLTAVANYSFVMQHIAANEEPDMRQMRAYAKSIGEQAIRAGKIVEGLRKLVKKQSPTRTTVQLTETIEKVLVLLQPELRQNQILLENSVNPELPALKVDEVQIEQVIVNLIRNAIDATRNADQTEKKIRIETSVNDSGEVEICIQDNGCGISADRWETVFEAFHTSKEGGMGMGLPISRSIAESHGGQLVVDAKDGSGVTFRLTLPQEQGGDGL